MYCTEHGGLLRSGKQRSERRRIDDHTGQRQEQHRCGIQVTDRLTYLPQPYSKLIDCVHL